MNSPLNGIPQLSSLGNLPHERSRRAGPAPRRGSPSSGSIAFSSALPPCAEHFHAAAAPFRYKAAEQRIHTRVGYGTTEGRPGKQHSLINHGKLPAASENTVRVRELPSLHGSPSADTGRRCGCDQPRASTGRCPSPFCSRQGHGAVSSSPVSAGSRTMSMIRCAR